MVSIVEVFCFLPHPNWPDFDQKMVKLGHFSPKMAQNEDLSDFHLIMS